MNASATPSSRLTVTQWLIVSLAAIGFAFDIYELLMMQFIIKDLIVELTGYTPGSPGFNKWGAVLFYVPALAGGVFGLYGGYLTDRLGCRGLARRTVPRPASPRNRAGLHPGV
jgi:hypothetical protein